MAEAVGLAASVVGLAAFGAKLSLTLYEYGDTIVHARKQIDSIANEVTLCSSVLKHVGTVLESEKATYSPALVVTTERIIRECKDLFREIRSKVKHRKRQSGRGMGRVKWLFDKPRAKELTAELEGLKSTLMLMVQTVTLATKASKSEEKSEQDIDEMKKELELLKSLIIANHHTILNLQEAEMEAVRSHASIPSISDHPPMGDPYGSRVTYHDTVVRSNPASGPIYQIEPSSRHGVTTKASPRPRPSYEGAEEEDYAHRVEHPENLRHERDKESGGPSTAPWRDSPVVILKPERDPDGMNENDVNKPDSRSPIVLEDHLGTAHHLPRPYSLSAPSLALHETNKTASHVPSTGPSRHSTSRLLIQEVPSGYLSGYYVMPSVKGLITEGGHQSNDRPPPSTKQDTTRTVQLLLNKWTKTGSSYVATLINEDLEGPDDVKAERSGRRSHRDTSRRQASANLNGDDSTSDSDSGSGDDSDMVSDYATIGDDSDVDSVRRRRTEVRPGDDYPQRPSNYRRVSHERLPGAQRYDIPRYGNPVYENYNPQPHPVHLPGAYPQYPPQAWKYPIGAGSDEIRSLEAKLDAQERYFSLQLEKLKMDMRLEQRDQRDAVEREAKEQALRKAAEYRAAEMAKMAAVLASEEAAAEEKYHSELVFEAWKPSLGRKIPGDENDEYDILELFVRKDRGGIAWSRGNDARLSLFVGPRKFLTVQFLPPSHLQGSEESDEYTIIGKEWVRREVLELFEHPFVEKEATFYKILIPLTFPQIRSLVRISFQLRKDGYAQTARSLMAERTSQLSSKDDEEVLHFSSIIASPPPPDQPDDVPPKKSRQPPDTSARQDKDKDRSRRAAGSGREQGRERRKARTSSASSRTRKLY